MLFAYLTKWGKEHKFDFIRISPYWERTPEALEMLKQAGFRISPIHMLSELVWKLDLDQDEQDLLKQMRKTTRNLIRRAEKDGVKINTSTEVEALDHFLALMKETHKRHSFIAYPDELYREQVKQFRNDDQVLVFNGEHDGKTLASAIIMYYGNAGSYHHGASIPSKIPVAHFLQWQAILEAKRRGCKEYSFWGVIDTDNKKHPFYGITTFKKGFGGDARYLVPAHDKPLSGRYFITYLIESMRRVRRGFGWRRT